MNNFPSCLDFIPLFNLGKQIGEYFGAALLTGDFNGDGEDDLIVGSPLFTNQNVGIFIIHQIQLGVFRNSSRGWGAQHSLGPKKTWKL